MYDREKLIRTLGKIVDDWWHGNTTAAEDSVDKVLKIIDPPSKSRTEAESFYRVNAKIVDEYRRRSDEDQEALSQKEVVDLVRRNGKMEAVAWMLGYTPTLRPSVED